MGSLRCWRGFGQGSTKWFSNHRRRWSSSCLKHGDVLPGIRCQVFFFSHCCSVVCYVVFDFQKAFFRGGKIWHAKKRLLSWYRLAQRTRSSGWHVSVFNEGSNLLVPKVISHVEFMWSWPEHCRAYFPKSRWVPISTCVLNPWFLSARIEYWYFHRLGMTRPYRTPLYL